MTDEKKLNTNAPAAATKDQAQRRETSLGEFLMSEHNEDDFNHFHDALGDYGVLFFEDAESFVRSADPADDENLICCVEMLAGELASAGERLYEMVENFKVHKANEARSGTKLIGASIFKKIRGRSREVFGSYREYNGTVQVISSGRQLPPKKLGDQSAKEVAELILRQSAERGTKRRAM